MTPSDGRTPAGDEIHTHAPEPSSGTGSRPTTTDRPRLKTKPGSFDRIRRDGQPDAGAATRDPQGKQVLFSSAEQPPPLGSVALECPNCHRRTIVSVVRLAQLSLPGVHAPVPGRGYRCYAKCPACSKRTWLQVQLGR